MANLPLAFTELLAGAIVLDAGIKGDSVANVIKGQAQFTPIQTPGTSSTTTTSSVGSGLTSTGSTTTGINFPGGAKTGKISWFTGQQTASGISINVPGIAVYNHSTLGGYWLMQAPNGRQFVVQQTDIGPAPWTGRLFDFTESLLTRIGYTTSNFPTDAQATGYYLGKTIPPQYQSLLIH